MAANIYGYQGVHTPLESVTQGRYTLADYTSMRTELTSRLIALENQGGFVPTNVEISGYLKVLPGGDGDGYIQSTSSITGESLYINSLAQCGSIECNGSLTVAGPFIASSATINGVSMQGNLNMNLNNITNAGSVSAVGAITAASFSGNGAALTNVTAVSCPYGGLTGAIPIWNQNTTGNAATATTANDPTKLPLSGGSLTGNLTVQAGSKYFGDGSSLTGISTSDPTKLPLSGGTMTGPPVIQSGISCETFISKDQGVGEVYAPPSNNSKWTLIALQFQNACSVNLVNFAVNPLIFADNVRHVTIMKSALAIGDFTVSVLPPAGYTFYSPSGAGSASYSIPAGKFSVTFSIWANSRLYLTCLI